MQETEKQKIADDPQRLLAGLRCKVLCDTHAQRSALTGRGKGIRAGEKAERGQLLRDAGSIRNDAQRCCVPQEPQEPQECHWRE